MPKGISLGVPAGRRGCLLLLLSSLLTAACGGPGKPATPVAERVCEGARTAAARELGYPTGTQVLSRDPVNVSCVVNGRGPLQVRIVTQTGSQAYTEFDTETSHQDQVYGAGIHEPGQIPQAIEVRGTVAVWIPAQREVVATDAEPGRGGTYVTVTVSGAAGTAALRLAQVITRATFAARPGLP
ncbi:MAG TPA: hypothetical protein VF781_10550 [Solirubrobacteraceae bacterium]